MLHHAVMCRVIRVEAAPSDAEGKGWPSCRKLQNLALLVFQHPGVFDVLKVWMEEKGGERFLSLLKAPLIKRTRRFSGVKKKRTTRRSCSFAALTSFLQPLTL